MVHFVGAGPGAADLITLRGANALKAADVVIYAGSLVSSDMLAYAESCREVYDSSGMTLEDIIGVIADADAGGKDVVRLHTGDPSVYGGIREQIEMLDSRNIKYDIVPGVSSFAAAAAALGAEYTVPGVSQTVILARMGGRTDVPEREDMELLASHGASMAVFLSASMLEELSRKLTAGGYGADSPAAIVYKASWDDEKLIRTTVGGLARAGEENGVHRTALILVGGFLGGAFERSKLYDPAFSHGYRPRTRG